MAAAAQDVDPVERVVGVGDDRFVFFAPVKLCEIQQQLVGQVGVGGSERRRRQGLAFCDDIVGLTVSGVLRERVLRVEKRRLWLWGVAVGRQHLG